MSIESLEKLVLDSFTKKQMKQEYISKAQKNVSIGLVEGITQSVLQKLVQKKNIH